MPSRRALLASLGSSATAFIAGCGQVLGSEDDIQDTDGDGVIDSEDYAPRDPAVDERSDLTGDTGATETAAGGTTATRTEPAGDVVFADDMESGDLGAWEEVVVPDRRNENVVDWDTTRDAIAGSYAAYCESVGDANNLRTREPIVDPGTSVEIGFAWRTSASNSRGIACKLTNGEDGEAFETDLFTRVGLDKNGTPRAQLNDREATFSTLEYGRPQTTTVRIADGRISVSLNGEERIAGRVDRSGGRYLTFDTSGHWGAESTMTLDDVRVSRI
jgi:hypothetical protein